MFSLIYFGASLAKLFGQTGKLFRNRYGNISTVFALSLPTIIMASGASVDYTRISNAQQQLQLAVDSVSLGTLAGERFGKNADDVEVKSSLVDFLKTNAPNTPIELSSIEIKVEKNFVESKFTSIVNVSAGVNTSFLAMLNIPTYNVSAKSSASMDMDSRVDLHMVIDTSDSMGLAATESDRALLRAASTRAGAARQINPMDGGCEFACHRKRSATDPLSMLDVARENNVHLRIDVAKNGATDVINLALQSFGGGSRTRMSLWTLNNSATLVTGLTSNISQLLEPISQIQIGDYNWTKSSNTEYNIPLATVLNYVRKMVNPVDADNRTITYNPVVLLVTDGVKSTIMGQNADKTAVQEIQQPWCDQLKNQGVKVAVLYTRYLASWGQRHFEASVAGFYDKIEPALRNCASPGLFAVGDSPDEIRAAFSDLFKTIKISTRITM